VEKITHSSIEATNEDKRRSARRAFLPFPLWNAKPKRKAFVFIRTALRCIAFACN
jgi:hypothetical protein